MAKLILPDFAMKFLSLPRVLAAVPHHNIGEPGPLAKVGREPHVHGVVRGPPVHVGPCNVLLQNVLHNYLIHILSIHDGVRRVGPDLVLGLVVGVEVVGRDHGVGRDGSFN